MILLALFTRSMHCLSHATARRYNRDPRYPSLPLQCPWLCIVACSGIGMVRTLREPGVDHASDVHSADILVAECVTHTYFQVPAYGAVGHCLSFF